MEPAGDVGDGPTATEVVDHGVDDRRRIEAWAEPVRGPVGRSRRRLFEPLCRLALVGDRLAEPAQRGDGIEQAAHRTGAR